MKNSERGPFKRILLKISGEMLAGPRGFGLDPEVLGSVAEQVHTAHASGVEIGLVIGGGNLFRGIAGAARGMDRVRSDAMGMLATVINALAFQDALEAHGSPTRVLTSIPMSPLAEPYVRDTAVRHLVEGRVVIAAGGTGNPFFSTDTAAALRAVELGADVLLKGTKVDGVYDRDPKQHADAMFIPRLGGMDFIRMGLRVMDTTAVTLCMENQLPVVVFDIVTPGRLANVIRGEQVGTWIGFEAKEPVEPIKRS
jgi:uridylate kinase